MYEPTRQLAIDILLAPDSPLEIISAERLPARHTFRRVVRIHRTADRQTAVWLANIAATHYADALILAHSARLLANTAKTTTDVAELIDIFGKIEIAIESLGSHIQTTSMDSKSAGEIDACVAAVGPGSGSLLQLVSSSHPRGRKSLD